jgi:enamine deaminase RidA (YjgF/YER057c/UK114 family)
MNDETDIQHHGAGDIVSISVVHNGIVYLSGLTDETPKGHSTYEQTVIALAEIDKALAQAGTHKARILTAQIWLSDLADFDEMNRAWMEWLGALNPPARACVEAKLAGPHYRVEIMVTAAQPPGAAMRSGEPSITGAQP